MTSAYRRLYDIPFIYTWIMVGRKTQKHIEASKDWRIEFICDSICFGDVIDEKDDNLVKKIIKCSYKLAMWYVHIKNKAASEDWELTEVSRTNCLHVGETELSSSLLT